MSTKLQHAISDLLDAQPGTKQHRLDALVEVMVHTIHGRKSHDHIAQAERVSALRAIHYMVETKLEDGVEHGWRKEKLKRLLA
jgi:hypothetical protein